MPIRLGDEFVLAKKKSIRELNPGEVFSDEVGEICMRTDQGFVVLVGDNVGTCYDHHLDWRLSQVHDDPVLVLNGKSMEDK